MKKACLLVALAFSIGCVGILYDTCQAAEKIRVGVLPFEENNQTYNVSERVTAQIGAGLLQMGRFELVERAELEKIAKEQALSLSGMLEKEIEVGKIKNVDALVLGKITNVWVNTEPETIFFTTNIKVRLETEIKLVDVKTGEIKFSGVQDAFEKRAITSGVYGVLPSDTQVQTEANALIGRVVDECTKKIIAKISEAYTKEGKVLKVEGETVWISLGRTDGVKKGQKLKILQVGEELKDPDTGEVLGATKKEIGEVEITRVEDKTSESQIRKMQKEAQVKVGDKVASP